MALLIQPTLEILLAPDKFKGSLSAQEVCLALGRGLQAGRPLARLIHHPMADGGDGSLAVLSDHLALEKVSLTVSDPLGRQVQAHYLCSAEAAFVEVAAASGLVRLAPAERNPLHTSSYGTGQLVAAAFRSGLRRVYLFLGGSATNDAGTGIAEALGYRFFDADGARVTPNGGNLAGIDHWVDCGEFDFQGVQFELLCDVDNPLYGPLGAARVYGPQKGASPDAILRLDAGLKHFADLLKKKGGKDIAHIPGSGAAGGIAGGMMGLLPARIQSGFTALANLTGLAQQIAKADLVISGEGRLDAQSLQGKVVGGVAGLCRHYHKPLVLVVGQCELAAVELETLGATAIYTLANEASDLQDAMDNAGLYLEKLARLI